jgi:hypothetical protein
MDLFLLGELVIVPGALQVGLTTVLVASHQDMDRAFICLETGRAEGTGASGGGL